MNSSQVFAGFVMVTAVWAGFGAFAIFGGPARPAGEFWTSTSSEKIASRPTLVRASYPAMQSAHARTIIPR